MFSPNVMKMITILVDNGIEVSLHRNQEGQHYADLHSGAKSHLHLSEQDGEVVFSMRYDVCETISADESVEALAYLAASCLAYRCICGRDFVGKAWADFCPKVGVTVILGRM